MNAKYVLALIFALQVSTCLCEVDAPSQELVDKYNTMKATFYRRLINAYNRLQVAAAPMVERMGDNQHGQAAKDFFGELQNKPSLQAVAKIASGLHEEAAPLVDKARTSALGAYEQYLRPHVGTYLNDFIEYAKTYLDVALPAN